jgi:hypothetical protein
MTHRTDLAALALGPRQPVAAIPAGNALRSWFADNAARSRFTSNTLGTNRTRFAARTGSAIVAGRPDGADFTALASGTLQSLRPRRANFPSLPSWSGVALDAPFADRPLRSSRTITPITSAWPRFDSA